MFLECKRLVGDAVELFGDGNQNHYKYIRDRVTRVDNLPHRLNYTSENHYVNVVGGDNKLSQRDECIKEFKKVFPHIKLEETEIPIEGG